MNRRGFLVDAWRRGIAFAGLCIYGLPVPGAVDDALEPEHEALLDAVADTLVPADEFPGALAAGVPRRLSALLESSGWRRRLYRRGLNDLASRAVGRYDRRFEVLSIEQRSEVLEEFKRGYGAGASFLRWVREDTLTAFYSSPEAYAMLGYEPPAGGYPYSPVDPDSGDG